eukprot:TRINITY_DN4129_c0_g1_i2.p1 TRINITY_DN4129_c0_g1~~TRINITY_DN4129_c0_g1_i2.p1  ORF type:complete len:564 (+),score=157.98 TRINITY_DN4129_c0_g1_i2:156-1847(+)
MDISPSKKLSSNQTSRPRSASNANANATATATAANSGIPPLKIDNSPDWLVHNLVQNGSSTSTRDSYLSSNSAEYPAAPPTERISSGSTSRPPSQWLHTLQHNTRRKKLTLESSSMSTTTTNSEATSLPDDHHMLDSDGIEPNFKSRPNGGYEPPIEENLTRVKERDPRLSVPPGFAPAILPSLSLHQLSHSSMSHLAASEATSLTSSYGGASPSFSSSPTSSPMQIRLQSTALNSSASSFSARNTPSASHIPYATSVSSNLGSTASNSSSSSSIPFPISDEKNLHTRLRVNDPDITHLSLAGLSLDSKRSRHLAESVRSNSTLTHLDISSPTSFRRFDKGIGHLAPGLAANRSIVSIAIPKAPAGSKIAKSLEDLIRPNLNITKILSEDPISDELRNIVSSNTRFHQFVRSDENSPISTFTLRRRSLKEFPPQLMERSVANRLVILDLSSNDLQTLHDMTPLFHLEELNISFNSLTSFPISICSLQKLRILNAQTNKISVLPDMMNLISLTCIDVSQNKLTSIPDSFAFMKDLVKFTVTSTPFKITTNDRANARDNPHNSSP